VPAMPGDRGGDSDAGLSGVFQDKEQEETGRGAGRSKSLNGRLEECSASHGEAGSDREGLSGEIGRTQTANSLSRAQTLEVTKGTLTETS